MQINEEKLHAFAGKMLGDLAGAFSVGLVQIGDRLGLYKALHASGPMTTQELADQTNTNERYIREWLAQQAASEYVDYDAATDKFELPIEKALVFAVDDSPVNMLGGFDLAVANLDGVPRVQDAFHTGEGSGWGDHSNCVFCAVEKFFYPSYKNHLVQDWLPALDGVIAKLETGAKVADIGCGHGASTLAMAEAFPNSEFVGFDFHQDSIDHANNLAKQSGRGTNISFDVALAKNFPREGYDLICTFDCLHDMGDPVGASAYIKSKLKPDGTFMVVEPSAADTLEDNFTPLGRIAYAASTLACIPTSLAQEVGLALGAQAGEARISQVIKEGGFASVRRAAETSFNMILEARL